MGEGGRLLGEESSKQSVSETAKRHVTGGKSRSLEHMGGEDGSRSEAAQFTGARGSVNLVIQKWFVFQKRQRHFIGI